MSDQTLAEAVVSPAEQVVAARVTSRSTRVAVGVMAFVWVALGALDYLAYSGRIGGSAADLVGGLVAALPLVVGIAMLLVARSIGRGGTIRLEWTFFALALVCAGSGGVIRSARFVQSGPVSTTFADVLFTLWYPLMLVGLVLAIRAYYGIVQFGIPLVVGAVVGVASGLVLYLAVLHPYVFAADVGQLARVAVGHTAFNPVADCLLLLGPAVMLALLARQLENGRVSWPWWIVALAIAALALADTAYAYMQAVGVGYTLVPDVVWMAAVLLLGLAPFVARDVYAA